MAGRYVLGMRHTAGSFELDDDPRRVDRDAVWAFLSQEAYWGRWRSRADLEHQLDSAWRVVGAYQTGSGRMAGFARALSDGVGYAYLADVFVVADARGQGLGTALVETMIDRGPGAGFRWCLHTSDAHGLYQKFGFTHPDRSYLERPPGGRHPAGPAQRTVSR
jgi:GNAT superfamily N-acetyltransferase